MVTSAGPDGAAPGAAASPSVLSACSTATDSSDKPAAAAPYEIDQYVKPFKYAAQKYYSMEDIWKHNKPDDCWVVIDGKVYDVTKWIPRHPGGELLISNIAGLDITDPFLVHHMPWVRESFLPKFQIGYVKDYKVTAASSEFREMAMDFEKAGWYQTNYWEYVRLGLFYTFLFVSAMLCIAYGNTWIVRVALGGFLLGMFWQQLAFFGHDVGHMAVTHNRIVDNLIGVILGNAFMGIAIGWWKATHNVHHLVTNYLEYDPDIQHLPVFAISDKFFSGIWSFYHKKRMEFDRIARVLVGHQHILFYPVMAVARFNLYLQSWLILINTKHAVARGVTFPKLEMAMLCVFYYGMYRIVSCLPTLGEQVGFIIWSHAAAGILHLQICISHFPMETLDSRVEKPLAKTDFPTQQLATCLDVDCPPWFDWFHGGLQFQTVHHLFPLMPRGRLRAATAYVDAYARRHGLTYYHVGFSEANRMIINGLKNTADRIHPWLIQLANAEG